MHPVLIGLLLTGLAGAGFVFAAGWWISHAEVGVDPFADLPRFDDDEAQALLEAGA